MLLRDPGQRLSIAGIQEHPWFQANMPAGLLELNAAVDPSKARQSEAEIAEIVREASASTRGGLFDADNIDDMADDILAEEEADDLLEGEGRREGDRRGARRAPTRKAAIMSPAN